jgi:hypothetical protein
MKTEFWFLGVVGVADDEEDVVEAAIAPLVLKKPRLTSTLRWRFVFLFC